MQKPKNICIECNKTNINAKQSLCGGDAHMWLSVTNIVEMISGCLVHLKHPSLENLQYCPWSLTAGVSILNLNQTLWLCATTVHNKFDEIEYDITGAVSVLPWAFYLRVHDSQGDVSVHKGYIFSFMPPLAVTEAFKASTLNSPNFSAPDPHSYCQAGESNIISKALKKGVKRSALYFALSVSSSLTACDTCHFTVHQGECSA